MTNLSEYALKGYLTQLKEEMESSYSNTSKYKDSLSQLLQLIQKSVSFMEAVYSEAPDLIDVDSSYDYFEMVKILQANDINYQGNQSIIEIAGAKWRHSQPIVKKPMQKASGKFKSKANKQQRTGTDSD